MRLAACIIASGLDLSLGAQEPPGGPLPLRDDQVLAQARLSLPAESAELLAPGASRLRLSLAWANTFAWTQDVPGEAPRERVFLLDAETAALRLEWRRGLTPRLEVGAQAELLWRGAGALDGPLDAFHRAFAFAGVGDGGRPAFRRDAYRVLGRRHDGVAFDWREHGAGLGPLETQARWRLGSRGAWARALVARVQWPAGSGAFAGGGVAGGLQLVATRPLGQRARLSLGLGGSGGGDRRVDAVGYVRVRGHAFAALERRMGGRLSLLLQTDAATRLVSDVARYPGEHWLVHAGMLAALGAGTTLELALSENLRAQQSTADVALQAGLRIGAPRPK